MKKHVSKCCGALFSLYTEDNPPHMGSTLNNLCLKCRTLGCGLKEIDFEDFDDKIAEQLIEEIKQELLEKMGIRQGIWRKIIKKYLRIYRNS